MWLQEVNWLMLSSAVALWFSVVYWGEPALLSGAGSPPDTVTDLLRRLRSRISQSCLCLTANRLIPSCLVSLSDWGNEAVTMQKQVTADRHWLPHQRNRSPSNKWYDSFSLWYTIINIFRYLNLAFSSCTCLCCILKLAVSQWAREVRSDPGSAAVGQAVLTSSLHTQPRCCHCAVNYQFFLNCILSLVGNKGFIGPLAALHCC